MKKRMSTLKAGRELDAIIAENVMEIVPCDSWDRPIGVIPGLRAPPQCAHDGACYSAELGPLHFSTDIAAAWRVVEKLLATPLDDGDYPLAVVVRAERRLCSQPSYFCTIEAGVANEDIEAYGSTAAEAICLAALKARGA